MTCYNCNGLHEIETDNNGPVIACPLCEHIAGIINNAAIPAVKNMLDCMIDTYNSEIEFIGDNYNVIDAFNDLVDDIDRENFKPDQVYTREIINNVKEIIIYTGMASYKTDAELKNIIVSGGKNYWFIYNKCKYVFEKQI